jgi:PAS domain S-box-containing protein
MPSYKDKSPSTGAADLCRNAKERLPANAAELHPSRTEEETQRIVHELEVHQIELEMQNAELRRVQEELELSRNRYAELFDVAPVGYFILDAGGGILEVNSTGAQLVGANRQLLLHRPFAGLIADADGKETFARHLKSVLQERGMQRCEVSLSRKHGTVILGELQSVKVDTVAGKQGYVLTSIVDGTVAKQLRDELEEEHASLELLVSERTHELTSTNVQLTQEIGERKRAEESLRGAIAEIEELKDRLQAENVYLQQEVSAGYNFGEIIGQSTALSYVFLRVEQVAPQDATVLLLGETGTGKGVIARAIHGRSARKDRPMITVNCTSLPANLIESELFGRERGAFTGASARQIGRFELADGGTIFLDEIGEMPLELQSKLLRVIQDGEFERLGGPRTVKVDVRIIAASNRNLEEEVRNGRFREDLFYRLNVFPITIPPLRERKDDIPLLVSHFVAKLGKKTGKKIEIVSKATLKTLQEYQWPGNVRELESVIERAVITSQGPALQVLDRFDAFRKAGESLGQDVKALAELEHDHILRVLQKTGWRIEGNNGAALLLGLNPSTLRARMRKYGIRRD